MNLAPIILFVYNRPEHTQRTLEALSQNEFANQSELYIYADGPKENATADTLNKISAVRELIKNKKWCKEVHIIEKTSNSGLANSIISGVTEIINKHGKAIILEDDLITSKYFLKFMNDALYAYEHEEKVNCISGYIYPVTDLPNMFFIEGADCWGWATWKRAWNEFELDGAKLLAELEAKNLTSKFDFNNCYPYTQMLRDQISGKNNSWAIRWYASSFLKHKLCLYPGKSLVQNIGTDGSGMHCEPTEAFNTNLYDKAIPMTEIEVKEDLNSIKQIGAYFTQIFKEAAENDPKQHFKNKVKSILPQFLLNAFRQLRSVFSK